MGLPARGERLLHGVAAGHEVLARTDQRDTRSGRPLGFLLERAVSFGFGLVLVVPGILSRAARRVMVSDGLIGFVPNLATLRFLPVLARGWRLDDRLVRPIEQRARSTTLAAGVSLIARTRVSASPGSIGAWP